jgi:hypothetical protein
VLRRHVARPAGGFHYFGAVYSHSLAKIGDFDAKLSHNCVFQWVVETSPKIGLYILRVSGDLAVHQVKPSERWETEFKRADADDTTARHLDPAAR